MNQSHPILRSLDPYHARLGYLGTLASLATRGLDRQDALMARYNDFLFERLFPDDPRFNALMERVDPTRRGDLLKRKRRPEGEDPSAAFLEVVPQPNERPPEDWLLTGRPKRPLPRLVNTDWLYVSEFWLYDAAMPSALGFLPKERSHRTLDLARWTGVLLPTLELSETGYLLKHLLAQAQQQQGVESSIFNPLNPAAQESLPLLYFRLMLQHDTVLPYLTQELVDTNQDRLATRGESGLLLRSIKRMLATIGEVSDPEDVVELRDLNEFIESISPPKDSTQENYLRPRLENLVDLGLLGRKTPTSGKRSDFSWVPTHHTHALASEMRPLIGRENSIPSYLDQQFFSSWGRLYGRNMRRIVSDDERLLWFARAFRDIGREFGFTPGRTLALKSCVMAWEAGSTMEMADVATAVYGAARSRWAPFLRFSGGSRFDSEFLIRIDDAMLGELEGSIPTQRS